MRSHPYFKENPNKILGTVLEGKGFRGSDLIKGDLSNLEAIDVDDELMPDFNGYGDSELTKTPLKTLKQIQKNYSHAIEKTKDELKAEPLVLKGNYELYSFEDFLNTYNKHLTKDEIEVWLWYKKAIDAPISSGFSKYLPKSTSGAWFKLMLERGYLCVDPSIHNSQTKYIPSPLYYSGNIYDKIKALEKWITEHKKPVLPSKAQAEKQIRKLKAILPPKLLLTGKENERLTISPISAFAKEFNIIFEGAIGTIFEHFKVFLSALNTSDMKLNVSPMQIVDYYLNNNRFPRDMFSKHEKAEIKRNGAIEAARLMSIFLGEVLWEEQRKSIEDHWNRLYNGFIDVNFDKIPVAFRCSKYFKTGELQIRDAQREGVAFQSALGSGIIAYDVGVGKTMTAILAIGHALENGDCKRPIIAVPNPTYHKWIKEISGDKDKDGNYKAHGILPHVPILDLFNLSEKYERKLFNEKGELKQIKEGTIIMVTYEGLSRIGFSEKLSEQLHKRMVETISQGFQDETERKKALENEKIEKAIGIGLDNTIVGIDELEADYLCIDEAHNFNKIFTQVKGEQTKGDERKPNQYQISSGKPSARGIKAFFLSTYIQSVSKQRNISLLTATPFNNSPLEVFSMLALTGYERLKRLGINNIQRFFDNYVNQTFEKAYTAAGEIEPKAVIKSFSNKVSLQKVLFSFMNYKSGEDAGIVRPKKWVLPMLNEKVDGKLIPLEKSRQVTTYLKATDFQKTNFKEISDELIDALSDPDKKDSAPHLVAISKAKKNTLSPYILNEIPIDTISPSAFIKSSPKLTYVMGCVKSVKDYHDKKNESVSGQVIYMNGGKDYFPLIQDYLFDEIGFKRDIIKKGKATFSEVEIITGNTKENKKEQIKEFFLAGIVKIIIGTSTIKEGIDLQNNASTLYNLTLDWNPTDVKQLEGRIWRFGNAFENVRIVTPLLIGSSDAFIFQKIEEKSARINDLFNRKDKANMLDTESINPEEVKWSLIDDTKALAKSLLAERAKEMVRAIKANKESLSELESIEKMMDDRMRYQEQLESFVDGHKSLIKTPSEQKDILTALIEDSGKILRSDTISNYDRHNITWRRNALRRQNLKLERLKKYVKTKFSKDSLLELDGVKETLANQIEKQQKKLEWLKDDSTIEKEAKKLEKEKKKFNQDVDSLEETIERFSSLNHLLEAKKEVQTVEDTSCVPCTNEAQKAKSGGKHEAFLKRKLKAFKAALEFLKGKDKQRVEKNIEGVTIALEFINPKPIL